MITNSNNASTCTSSVSFAHPHNLLQNPFVVKEKIEASKAMDIINSTINKWEIKDIQEPGFSLTNVDLNKKPIKLTFENESTFFPNEEKLFSLSESYSASYDANIEKETIEKTKPKTESYSCDDVIWKKCKKNQINNIVEIIEDYNKDEVKLPFVNEVSDELPLCLKERHSNGLSKLENEALFTDTDLDDLLVLSNVKETNKSCNKETNKNFTKEPISFLETWVYHDSDILTLSGLSFDNLEEDEMQQDFRASLLRYVTNNDIPKGCNLGLDDKKLLVNGAPTKISAKAIEMAFCGLAELVGPKKSIEIVGKIVSRKLKKVF